MPQALFPKIVCYSFIISVENRDHYSLMHSHWNRVSHFKHSSSLLTATGCMCVKLWKNIPLGNLFAGLFQWSAECAEQGLLFFSSLSFFFASTNMSPTLLQTIDQLGNNTSATCELMDRLDVIDVRQQSLNMASEPILLTLSTLPRRLTPRCVKSSSCWWWNGPRSSRRIRSSAWWVPPLSLWKRRESASPRVPHRWVVQK